MANEQEQDDITGIEVDVPSCADHGEFDLSCQRCVAILPQLTAKQKMSMSSLGEDFIPRLFLANQIAEHLVDKDLIPCESVAAVGSAICSYLNGRVVVNSSGELQC